MLQDLSRQPVGPLATFILAGLDGEAHLLSQLAGNEAPDAVVLPVGGLGDLGQRCTVLAAQELDYDALFAAVARFGGRFGRLLAGGGLLLGNLLGRGLRFLLGRRCLGGFLGLGRALLVAGALLRG